MPVPGVSQVPCSPLKPSVTAYMAFTRSLLKPKRSMYAPTDPRHSFTKCSRRAGRTKRSAVASIDSGSCIQVGAMSSRICATSVIMRSLASQSASLKNSMNCRLMAA